MPPNIATTQPNRINLSANYNFTGALTLNGSAVITQNSPGNGTVTNVSVSSTSGIVSSVDTPTATPVIHLSLGAITPTSVLSNGTLGGSNFSGTSSGTNTGDQTISLTGDITGSGTGSFAATIGAGKVTEAMQVLADNVTNNVSTQKHGYVPKAPNDTGVFLRGDASWSAMPIPPPATEITVANEAQDATCFPLFVVAATGDLGPKTNTNLSFNSNTGVATFGQTIVGSISGNAATVTTNADLTGDVTSSGNATTIGSGKVTEAMQVLADNTTNDVSTSKHGYTPKAPNDTSKFLRGDGSWAVMPIPPPAIITVANEATDATCFPLFVTAATGDLGPKTNANLSFDSNTGIATFGQTIVGSISGNAATVTTNANLTGPITSSGNTTSVASQTGIGSTFVMDSSPTLETPVLGVASATSIAIGGGSAVSALAAGVYTPTRSAEANLDGNVTMSEAQYMRVGNTCTVSGRFTADPTLTATSTSFEITLPVASNIGAAEDAAGVAFCGTIAGQGAAIFGVANNDTAKIQWVSTDITEQSWSYTFTFQII